MTAPDRVDLADLEGTPAAEALGGSPRVVRLRLTAGESIDPHSHPGTTVVIHVVEGVLDARLDGEPLELSAGELLRFPGEREVAPLAVEDAVALVFLAERA